MSYTQLGSLILGAEVSAIAVVYALVVLTTLALIIKGLTYLARPKKSSTNSVEAPKESLEVSDVELAVAIAAIHKYLMDKGVSGVKRTSTSLSSGLWVTSWRLECSSGSNHINYRVSRISRE